jgi:nucleotide-binding universal stress UspA family protein
MFKKILLPVDLSDRHGPAVKVATELARQSSGEVLLLHVIELIGGISLEEERAFYNRLEKAARQHLGRLAAVLDTEKIPGRSEVRYGHRAPEVARYAAEAGADLIVLTAPRFDPQNPGAVWGSLSYKVGYLAACPVLLVK